SYEMCQTINEAIFKADGDAITKRDLFYNTDFLIIDDLGTEIDTQISSKSILDLINYRLSKNLKTLITSNLNVDAIKENYGERLSSRILSNYYIYRFKGRDLRLR
ncbi:MAG: DNA replication protein DnaC, partial [Fenollaria timonensis]